MNTIRIGSETKSLTDATESWINKQKRLCGGGDRPRRAEHSIGHTGVWRGGEGGHAPNTNEQEVFDLWSKRGLNSADFAGGNLVAFLKQLRRLVS